MKTEGFDEGKPGSIDCDSVIRCWCGAEGTYDQLFDASGLPAYCDGSGVMDCECGGDLCVCHHHGEADCPGCEMCDPDEWDEDWGEDDDQQ